MRFSRITAATAALAAVALLAACSSTDSGGGSPSSGSSAASPAVAAAKATVAEYEKVQAPVSIPALPKPAKPGLTVAITTCPLPVCHTTTDAAVTAAKKLGWVVKSYESPLTPEGYQAMWNQVMQNPPDLIAFTAVTPNATIKAQLQQAASLHIPVVAIAPNAVDRPDKAGPVYGSYNGYPEFLRSGQLEGDVIVADGGTGKDTVFVWDPSLQSIWQPIKDGFFQAIGKSGSKPSVLEAAQSGIGTDVPGQVVSYLQAHPGIKYVAFALGDYTAGVPAALNAVGISVKIVSRAPQAANLANVKNGTEFAAVGEENSSNGWRAIDGLARLSEGLTPDDDWFEPAGWHQIFVADNVTETTKPPTTPGVPEVFLKAWGVD